MQLVFGLSCPCLYHHIPWLLYYHQVSATWNVHLAYQGLRIHRSQHAAPLLPMRMRTVFNSCSSFHLICRITVNQIQLVYTGLSSTIFFIVKGYLQCRCWLFISVCSQIFQTSSVWKFKNKFLYHWAFHQGLGSWHLLLDWV